MGFQTYSMSEGITQEERKEIEAHCIYIPPENLPTQPTKEEIKKLFPVALSSFRLKHGKYCICQSKYVGKDYSGRYGNYFSHVLISDEPWPFYPIELYDSITFRDSLTFEEEIATEISPLPHLDKIHLGNKIDFIQISKFLKGTEMGVKRKSLQALINSIVTYEKEGKNIIFWDCKDNNPYWIGAIQMALPKNLANNFSFTTYCYSPENINYTICALDKEGSVFSSKNNQKLYKYTVIDFNAIKAQVTSTSFSKLVEVGYTVSNEVLLSFLSFVQQFEYSVLDEDIEDCICLYNIVNKGIERLNVENVKKAINFANTYKSEDAFSKLFKQITPNLEKISTQVDMKLTEIVTEFLFNMGRETKNEEYIEKAYKFFFHSIHSLVMDAEDTDIKEIFKLYKRIREKEKLSNEEFIKMSLDKKRIEELDTYLEGAKSRHAKFYLQAMIDDVIMFNKGESETNKIELFNRSCEDGKIRDKFLIKCMDILLHSPKDLEEVIYYFKDEVEYVSDIMIKEYKVNSYKCRSELAEKTLFEFLINEGENDKYWRDRIYSSICKKTSGIDFIFYLFKYEVEKNKEDKTFFTRYCKDIFNMFVEYRNKKFWDCLEAYTNLIEENHISLEEYKNILMYIYKIASYTEVNKKLLEKVIVDFEDNIHIDNVDIVYEDIKEIEKLKNKYKIKTPCSITELICIHKFTKEDESKSKIKGLGSFKGDFSHISSNKYKEYLKWILPNLSAYIKDYTDHSKIKKAFFCEDYKETYYKCYTDVIMSIFNEKKYKNILKQCNKEVYEILLDYIIFILKNGVDFEEDIEVYVEDKIISTLQSASERKMSIYEEYILKKIKDDRNEKLILKQWKKIKMKSMEKNKLKNILSFFKI
ncbi:Uncharacterised protein [Clostridium tetanomorphum]|nr:Uncharacterised protein [Clostridium tetanomorphum]